MPLFERVNAIVDFSAIEAEIANYYQKGKSVDGRNSYPILVLFKMMLLQTWYGLSDEGIEEQINDRISFSKFCGISMEAKAPDSTVLCRFRSVLNKNNTFETLLTMINKRLEEGNLMVITGVIVDASVTTTLRKPRGKKEDELVPEDRKEDDTTAPTLVVKHKPNVDREAAWIIKGGKFMYGYKQHTVTNQEGFILGVHTTADNESDVKNLAPALNTVNLKPRIPVFADKGYVSADNEHILINKRLKSRVLHKAVKGKPLTELEKLINKKISQTRYKIERSFGSIHKWFRGAVARYVGKAKMHSQHLLQAICYNLYRMPVIAVK